MNVVRRGAGLPMPSVTTRLDVVPMVEAAAEPETDLEQPVTDEAPTTREVPSTLRPAAVPMPASAHSPQPEKGIERHSRPTSFDVPKHPNGPPIKPIGHAAHAMSRPTHVAPPLSVAAARNVETVRPATVMAPSAPETRAAALRELPRPTPASSMAPPGDAAATAARSIPSRVAPQPAAQPEAPAARLGELVPRAAAPLAITRPAQSAPTSEPVTVRIGRIEVRATRPPLPGVPPDYPRRAEPPVAARPGLGGMSLARSHWSRAWY